MNYDKAVGADPPPKREAAMRNHEMILRIVALALLLYALGSLAASSLKLRQTEAETLALEQKLSQLREENAALQAELGRAGTEEEILLQARQRLGLVLPGETIFCFPTADPGQ